MYIHLYIHLSLHIKVWLDICVYLYVPHVRFFVVVFLAYPWCTCRSTHGSIIQIHVQVPTCIHTCSHYIYNVLWHYTELILYDCTAWHNVTYEYMLSHHHDIVPFLYIQVQKISLRLQHQCGSNKDMTGNCKHSTSKNGDDWGSFMALFYHQHSTTPIFCHSPARPYWSPLDGSWRRASWRCRLLEIWAWWQHWQVGLKRGQRGMWPEIIES